jgi:hypothetical protein
MQPGKVMTGLLAGPLTGGADLGAELARDSRSGDPPAFGCGSATAAGTG